MIRMGVLTWSSCLSGHYAHGEVEGSAISCSLMALRPIDPYLRGLDAKR